MSNCIFCKIARESSEEKIYENDNFFSIFDASPVTDGHSLVISRNHYKTTLDIPNTMGLELLDCIKNTTLKIIEKTKAEGFNIINNNFSAAGQVVHHVHFHIVPRKKDDWLNGKLMFNKD
jgi:histidine triad (HIT) family protein